MYLYFVFVGLAYQNGINEPELVMPKKRFCNLYKATLETKGFEWADKNFIKWVVGVAVRENRPPVCPVAGDPCKYRLKYVTPIPQKNALRIEIMNPQNRCGWDLIPGRIGGHIDDYYICSTDGPCGVAV